MIITLMLYLRDISIPIIDRKFIWVSLQFECFIPRQFIPLTYLFLLFIFRASKMYRCDGLYRSQCNVGGPIHITIGTAGAHLNDRMTNEDRKPIWTDRIIFQTYGYGRVTVKNSTALHFEFVKNGNEQYDSTAGTVLDETYIIRSKERSSLS
jgi:Iron/zinc purple acid phosphatase-like protein C